MAVPDDDALAAMMDAAAATLDLEIPAECRPGVVENLRMLLAWADALSAVDTEEPEPVEVAPVFAAGGP